jgi:hypothetical protein
MDAHFLRTVAAPSLKREVGCLRANRTANRLIFQVIGTTPLYPHMQSLLSFVPPPGHEVLRVAESGRMTDPMIYGPSENG